LIFFRASSGILNNSFSLMLETSKGVICRCREPQKGS
jgi:hypothetical protein